jgi:hypothetical protein
VSQTLIRFPLTSEAALYNYIVSRFGVKVSTVTCCERHPTSPWRAFSDAYFARKSPVHLWKGSRGFAGKSFLAALLGAAQADTLACEVKILGGSGAQSKRVLGHMQALWKAENFPQGRIISDNVTIARFANGGSVEALLASGKQARGPHPPRLILDEVDEMSLDIIDSAMGQPMSAQTKYGYVPKCTVMASTEQHADGPMAEMKRRARRKGWVFHEWCYRANLRSRGGWLEDSEVDSKRNEVTEEMWRTEYEGQEPNPQARAFAPSAVVKMFQRSLGEWLGPSDSTVEYIEFEPPVSNGTYAHGGDWARKVDFTEIITWRTDVRPMRLVAYERIRRAPWPYMIGRFRTRILRYGGSAAHDATGGGDVIDHMILGNAKPEDFVGREEYMELDQIAEPVIMVGQKRRELFSNYIVSVERGDFVSPFIEPLYDQHYRCSVDDLFGGSESGHPPDGVVAGALGLRAYLEPINPPAAWVST